MIRVGCIAVAQGYENHIVAAHEDLDFDCSSVAHPHGLVALGLIIRDHLELVLAVTANQGSPIVRSYGEVEEAIHRAGGIVNVGDDPIEAVQAAW